MVKIMPDCSTISIGAKDYHTPLQLVQEYYEAIETPQKAIFVFNNSVHTPFLAETEKFNQKIIQLKGKINH